MSQTASLAAKTCDIPCWRFLRPAWQAGEKDHWQMFSTMSEIIAHVADKQSLFITAGQLAQAHIDQLAEVSCSEQKQLLRVAMPPKHSMPSSMQCIKAIGPFTLENELAILREHAVDAVISKNSGGKATLAKIQAASVLNLPVYMLKRPAYIQADKNV